TLRCRSHSHRRPRKAQGKEGQRRRIHPRQLPRDVCPDAAATQWQRPRTQRGARLYRSRVERTGQGCRKCRQGFPHHSAATQKDYPLLTGHKTMGWMRIPSPQRRRFKVKYNNYTTVVLYPIVSAVLGVLSTSQKKVVLSTGAILSKREKRKRSESLFLYAECRGFFSSASARVGA